MPDLLVETPEGVTLRHELAGAGSRAAAGIVDFLILILVWGSLALVLVIVASQDPTAVSQVMLALLLGGGLLLPVVYQVAFTLLWDGRTPGKRLLGLRVADAGGYPAGSLQLVLRALFWPFEAILLVFPVPVALLLISLTDRRQRLGDLVGGTVVLRDRARARESEPFPRETWSGLEKRRLDLVPALAARLDGEDYRFLRSLLGRRELSPRARSRLLRTAARRYGEVLGIEEAPESGDGARLMLKELYLYMREARGKTPPAPARGIRATRPRARGAAAGRGSAPAPGSPPR